MADSETESTSPEQSSSSPNLGTRVRRFFVTLGAVGLVALGVTGFVALRDRQADRELEESLAAASEACDARLESLQDERNAAVADANSMHAFLDVAAARDEIAKGNFGTARERTAAAAEHLKAAGHEGLAAQVAVIDIQVTEDLAAIQEVLERAERTISKLVEHPELDGAK